MIIYYNVIINAISEEYFIKYLSMMNIIKH